MRYLRHLLKKSFSILSWLAFMVLLLAPLLMPKHAGAVSKTWDGGCGADTNWSCANNWSDNIVPASGDTVTFDNTSDNSSTVDALFNATETITTININSGYDGTITLATTLHVTTSWVQGAGIFTASNQTLDMNGTFTLSAGSFTASSGSTTLAGAMTISGTPTFTHNSGTFTFDGGTTATLSCNSVSFNLVTFAHTTGTKTVSSNCSLSLGSNPTLGTHSGSTGISLNGTLSGSGTLTTGVLSLSSTYALSGFSGLDTGSNLTITGATANFSSFTPFDVNGIFTLSSGAVFTAPSGTMTVAGAFTLNSGTTFNANSGTVTFDTFGSISTATLSCNSVAFNLVTFAHTSGTKTVSSNCSLPLGADPTTGSGASSKAITLNGTLSGSGTLTIGPGGTSNNSLTINSTGALSGFSGLVVNGASGATVISGTTISFSSYTTFDINGSFTLQSSASFTAPSGTATFAAGFTLNSGTTFSANSGTVTFDGSGGTLACNSATFNLVTFNKSGGNAVTINSSCSLPLGSGPTIVNGTSTMTLNGTLSGSGTLNTGSTGTFKINSGASLSGFSGLSTNAFTVDTINLNLGGYSTFVAAGAVTIQNSGTLTVPNGADFNSTFTLSSSGVFNAPSGIATFASSFTLNSGTTFNANGGTVTFDGSTGTLSCNNATFNLVTFNHTSTKTVSSDCSLPLGNNPTISSGTVVDLIVSGTLSGTGTLTIADAVSGNLLTLNSTASISGFSGLVAGAITISGATIDFGSYSTFDVNGAFTLSSSAVFTAPTGTATFASTFTLNSGTTFNANGGTVTFDGGGAVITCNNATFNLVIMNKTVQANSTISADCNLPLGNNPTAHFGDSGSASWTINGVLSGSGTLTTGAFSASINSPGALSGFNGLMSTSGIITFSGGTVDFGNYSPAEFRKLTLSNGVVFTAPTNELRTNDFTFNTGTTFNANGGTVVIEGTDSGGTFTLTCNNAVFNLVRLEQNTRTVISNGCNLPLGNNPTISSAAIRVEPGSRRDFRLAGKLIGTGKITAFGVFRLDTGYELEGFTDVEADYVTVNGSTANFSSFNTLDVLTDFTIQSSGTFTAPLTNMTVGGNFTVESGSTFNHNNGTVILNGTDQEVQGTTFYNLRKQTPSTLTFPAGGTETILNELTLTGGAPDALLYIVSSTPGTPWQIDSQGTRDIVFVDVADSTNLDGTDIIACQSIDSDGNTGWNFNPDSCDPPDPDPDPDPDADDSGGSQDSSGDTTTYNPVGVVTYADDAAPTGQDDSDGTGETPSLDNGSDGTDEDNKSTENEPKKDSLDTLLKIVFVISLGLFVALVLSLRRKKEKQITF